MNLKPILIACAASLALHLAAALPPAEQLLPAETVFVLTVPDWTKAAATYADSPAGRLWRDAELKGFKEKFLTQFQSKVVGPLEREWGVKLADYLELLRGQVTLAITLKPAGDSSKPVPGWLLLIDTKDKSDQLKKNLADLKKKWVDAGKQVKQDKIRDLEFSTLVVTGEDLFKAARNVLAPDKAKEAGAEAAKATNSLEVIVGQSDSLLLVGSRSQDLEKILVRQAGGQTSCLADQADFQNSQRLFRDAVGLGWLDCKPLVALLNKAVGEAAASAKAGNPMMPKLDKLFSALGLEGLKTVAGSLSATPDGEFVQLQVNVPEGSRKGLFRIFSFDSKDANPPPFVPSDVVKFGRFRLDGRKAWATFESMLAEISPELSGILQMGLSTVGKDKDPNFDIKKALIGNLGDDIINYQKNPRGYTLAALNSAPELYLIGSPQADQLLLALKTVAALAVPPTSVKEREFLGRKVFSVPLPSAPGPGEAAEDKALQVSASGGYVAISTDEAILEEYLRSSEKKPKALSETSGLKEAADKIGGMSTGLWGYENSSETMRTVTETLRKDADALQQIFNLGAMGAGAHKLDLKAWLDFALLPPFERLAKYFNFAVYSGATTTEGLTFKFFSPTPPALK